MPDTITLKLTVYQPEIMADEGEQVGFEYDLEVVVPDRPLGATEEAIQTGEARCEVVPVTGTLSFPNPAAPVVSPFTGLIFIYDNAPVIGFPLTLIAQGSGELLPFNMNLAFPASPLYVYSGAIQFGDWPGPFSDMTCSFLSPQS
jgi:hypothetical protein